ncbi:MAG: DoxX family protein [Bacteroidota bacterium]
MEYLTLAFKIFIFISIINVWFIRFNKRTSWRGGEASNMREEFVTYGLSETMMYLVGGLKVLSATALLVSIWVPIITPYAAGVMVVLMACAIAMHLRVNDSLKKSIPAFIFLTLSILLIIKGYF